MTTKNLRFDIKALMNACGSPTAATFAERAGTNRKWVHNRVLRGLNWIEADELAIRCGFLPWEVWPEWDAVDPTDWLPPVCAVHGNEFVEDLADLNQACSACDSEALQAA